MGIHSKMAKLCGRSLPVPTAGHEGQSPVEPVVAHVSPVVAMVATPQNSGKARLAAMWKRKPASDAAEETLESSEFVMCFLFMNL